MKKTILFVLILLGIVMLNAQTSELYSLARPSAGGDLKLIKINLVDNTESTIKTYSSSEIDDYNPEITSFDFENNYFITYADIGNTQKMIAINTTSGAIAHSYTSSSFEPFSLETKGSKIYSLARPISGGDLQLVEFDIINGTETSIKTYTSTEIDDYNPEITSFDEANNYFITYADINGVEQIIAIDVSDGTIEHSYTSPNFETFSVEGVYDELFSLVRPTAGGDLQLVKFNLNLGTELSIKTYNSTEIDDYNPEITTFDFQNNQFITFADIGNDEKIVSLSTNSGSIDYSFQSLNNEFFSLEYSNKLNTNSYSLNKQNNIKVYPNPSFGDFYIDSKKPIKNIELINTNGEILVINNFNEKLIEAKKIPKGVYFIKTYFKDSYSFNKVIIK